MFCARFSSFRPISLVAYPHGVPLATIINDLMLDFEVGKSSTRIGINAKPSTSLRFNGL